ncbi:dihydroneopterin aldolase [Catenovulum agarivorans DS-2]|uniref:7,8-dihydroneopterin aldolase n=1 Tax=Catenovulum agarivorans DS-2 TaxID=1328313 RepID=W7QPQ6_9ALTE|nr:dihydroneopterin aldolase [Catenovulum agarivorans]EWH09873.1 dihydroneopterin aldolase [Catenovulum agarivorans DS-2]
MKDIVFIHNLTIETIIGVFNWEHKIKQSLILDLDIQWDNSAPAANDDLSLALDYSAVADFTQIYCSARQFELIETLGEKLCQVLFKKFPIEEIRLKITKPDALENARVGIVIERAR